MRSYKRVLSPGLELPHHQTQLSHLDPQNDPDRFQGVPRQRFVEALVAEGVLAFYGSMHLVSANPMFLNQTFYTRGCPVNCHLRDFIPVDYAAFVRQCPVAERACRAEAIWLEHRLLLGTTQDMDDIVAAMQKVIKNIDELSR